MQCKIPNLIGLSINKATELLSATELSYQFVELKNHREQYESKRVVRQSIQVMDDGELLIVEYTGFPTLEDENG